MSKVLVGDALHSGRLHVEGLKPWVGAARDPVRVEEHVGVPPHPEVRGGSGESLGPHAVEEIGDVHACDVGGVALHALGKEGGHVGCDGPDGCQPLTLRLDLHPLHDLPEGILIRPLQIVHTPVLDGVKHYGTDRLRHVIDVDGPQLVLARAVEGAHAHDLVPLRNQVQKLVLLAKHNRRPHDRRRGEVVQHRPLPLRLPPHPLGRRALVGRHRRHVDEAGDPRLRARARDVVCSLHVCSEKVKVHGELLLPDAVDHDVGPLDHLDDRVKVAGVEPHGDNHAQVAHQLQVPDVIVVAAVRHHDLRPDAAELVDDVPAEHARGSEDRGGDARDGGAAAWNDGAHGAPALHRGDASQHTSDNHGGTA
mmetsp:Transcript_52047/g.126160  ORF Transcript_52047/g.126160 Transcript_52047/m.126160 type:complete len:365 (-) Transcript_52047:1-1095(-)